MVHGFRTMIQLYDTWQKKYVYRRVSTSSVLSFSFFGTTDTYYAFPSTFHFGDRKKLHSCKGWYHYGRKYRDRWPVIHIIYILIIWTSSSLYISAHGGMYLVWYYVPVRCIFNGMLTLRVVLYDIIPGKHHHHLQHSQLVHTTPYLHDHRLIDGPRKANHVYWHRSTSWLP